jgi:hypothetical protein
MGVADKLDVRQKVKSKAWSPRLRPPVERLSHQLMSSLLGTPPRELIVCKPVQLIFRHI